MFCIISLCLNKKEIERISKLPALSAKKKEAKSEIIRKLLNEGWIFYWLKLYRTGKASIGKIAEELNLLANKEVIDLLVQNLEENL